MDKDSKFTRDDEGYIAVRVVNGTESLPAIDKDYLFARDENGNIAMRVVGAGGGGGGGSGLPDQTGNAGKFLKTDGETASWENTTSSPATAPTLVATNWSSNTQTITVQGVTASNTVIVGPIPTDAQDYADAGILCTGQALNSLTFTCVDVPATDLQVNIVIM